MIEKDSSQHESPGERDLHAFELEIDNSIDLVFAPATPATKFEPGAGPGETLDPDAFNLELDSKVDSLFAPFNNPGRLEESVGIEIEKQPAAIIEEAPPARSDEKLHRPERDPHMVELIEMLQAAYLGLDWELTCENMGQFHGVLQQLQPFAFKSSSSKSVFRVLEVVIRRLRDRPHAVNRLLIQLIRDAHALLVDMLLMDDRPGAEVKQRLKQVLDLFENLRQKALAIKTAKDCAATESVPVEARESVPQQAGGPSAPSISTGSEDLDSINAEIARLRAIAARLNENPSLAGFARSLDEIGASLSSRIGAICCQDNGGAGPGRREAGDACLSAPEGRCFKLPVRSIVTVAALSRKKALKIMEKGCATWSRAGRGLKGLLRRT